MLETAQIRLERLSRAHLGDLRRNANDEALWAYTYSTNPFRTERESAQWLHEALHSGHIAFAIVDKANGEAVGSTRYLNIVPEHRKLEIGSTFIARRLWRTHVNTHSKYLLFEHAFEDWNAVRVSLKGEAINQRSREAMVRIGASYEGTHRNYRIHPSTGQLRDVAFYSVIASEWPDVKSRLRTYIGNNAVVDSGVAPPGGVTESKR